MAAIDELDRLADLGVSVLELLPVHAFDPDEANYWGYMPVVFGAIHGPYGSSEVAAADELAALTAAAHERDIEVWLDVVFNHTTEEDEHGPAVQPAWPRRRRLLRAARGWLVPRTTPAPATPSTPGRRRRRS